MKRFFHNLKFRPENLKSHVSKSKPRFVWSCIFRNSNRIPGLTKVRVTRVWYMFEIKRGKTSFLKWLVPQKMVRPLISSSYARGGSYLWLLEIATRKCTGYRTTSCLFSLCTVSANDLYRTSLSNYDCSRLAALVGSICCLHYIPSILARFTTRSELVSITMSNC